MTKFTAINPFPPTILLYTRSAGVMCLNNLPQPSAARPPANPIGARCGPLTCTVRYKSL